MDRTSKRYRTAITLQHRMYGVAFLLLLVLFGWLTNAIFNKKFTEYVTVDLVSSKTGLQLPDNADVKLHGVIVGAVRGREVTDSGARLTLGIYPDHLETIPANVSARIIPKTLFGEKYVALQTQAQTPDSQAVQSISAGAVVEQTDVAIEVERVLNDFYPLLRAVQPADLNYTLTAMATALEGRGEEIGTNLVVLNDYLEQTNPQIPALVEDLRLLSQVSDLYREVLPEVARTLRNSVTTGHTFVEQEQKIQAFFADVTGFSSTSQGFLEANGDNIIRLGDLSVEQLRVFEKYAPEYPCLLDGIVRAIPRQAESFRNYTLHINLEQLPKQPRGFGPQDQAVYGDERGPHDVSLCRRAIDGEWGQQNLPPEALVPDIADGVDEPTGKGQSPNRPGFGGARAERAAVGSPDLSALLLGPLVSGREVAPR